MSVEGFVDKVTRLVKKRGMTQGGMARLLGVDPARVSEWKKGKGAPTFAQAIEMCRLAGASFDGLLDDSGGADAAGHARPLDADDLIVLGAFRGSPLGAREVTDLIRERVRAATGVVGADRDKLPVGGTHEVVPGPARRNQRTG